MNYFKLLLVFTFLIPIVAFSQIKEKNIDSSYKIFKKKEIEEKRQSCIRNLATSVETQEKQWSFSVSRL